MGKDATRDDPVGPSGTKIWRESSYDFQGGVPPTKNGNAPSGDSDNGGSYRFDFRNGAALEEERDPPSKLIGQFLHKQRESGDFSIDIDLEMAELRNDVASSSPSPPNNFNGNINKSKLLPTVSKSSASPAAPNRVSFDPYPTGSGDSLRRRGSRNGKADDAEAEAVSRLSSDRSFKRKSSLLKEKSKSRLLDASPRPPEKSGRVGARSGQLRSGFMGKGSVVDDEEDDPLLDEDLPDELKREKLDKWGLLQWASLVLIVALLVCTLAFKFLRNRELWKLSLWKWEVLVLVLICGRLVSGWVIRIIVFFVERNFLLRKRVLYFVYGVKKAVQNCLWLGLVLIAWHCLFDKRVARETNSRVLRGVTKVLVCLVVGTLLWLVKTLIVKVLASSFHVSTYFDRIQESLFNQYVIETLSGPPLVELRKNEEAEQRIAAEVQKLQNAGIVVPPALKGTGNVFEPRLIGSGGLQKSPRIGSTPMLSSTLSPKVNKGENGITIDHLHKLTPKNVSAWNMKRLINIIRYGALSTLDEQIRDSGHYDEDDSATKIRSEYEAKAAARKIFENVAKSGSRYIYLEDLMRFMPEDEALKTMNLFEGASESKRITKKGLKNWVVNAFRERRALALTLNDTKTAVNKLHRLINIVLGILIVLIWLIILGIATTKLLLFVSSQLVVVAFVFGNTCKTVFEAIIFLFVIHPFDVGDRCEVDGVQMIVEEMNILTTVFLRYDNQKIVIPNSVLATKAIGNFYRSPDMGDAVEFLIHISTPAEKIATLKQRITSYIDEKKEHWNPSPMIVFKDIEELNKVRMAVWLSHKMNFQDMGGRWSRRALLVEEMAKTFRELDLQYRLLPLEINVRALPAGSTDRLPSSWLS